MKKNTCNSLLRFCAPLLLILLVLLGCSEDISRPDPAVQGLKDGVQWRANDQYAVLHQDGSISVIGLTQYETLTMTVQNHNEATFIFGDSASRIANFTDTSGDNEISFSTGLNIGDGQLIIEDYDEVANTVTGTFRFNAVNDQQDPETGEILNFQQGHFYKVPVIPAGEL